MASFFTALDSLFGPLAFGRAVVVVNVAVVFVGGSDDDDDFNEPLMRLAIRLLAAVIVWACSVSSDGQAFFVLSVLVAFVTVAGLIGDDNVCSVGCFNCFGLAEAVAAANKAARALLPSISLGGTALGGAVRVVKVASLMDWLSFALLRKDYVSNGRKSNENLCC